MRDMAKERAEIRRDGLRNANAPKDGLTLKVDVSHRAVLSCK